ncbi:MAG: PIN domain-containing protein [Dehalococcoidia bacterium]|nr:PIN domain-containing protein [Dehalococcoidia bacterium]
MRYLDTNVFVRHLTADDARMSPAARELFRKVERGEEDVAVLEATIAEVVYVLSSRTLYALTRANIRERVRALLVQRGLHMEDKSRCLRALDVYATYRGLNFGDALIVAAALAESPHEVYSFDRGFDAVAGVGRVEP